MRGVAGSIRDGAWAVVPAKALLRGKSRLSPALNSAARVRLARDLLVHVLDVLGACGLSGTLVATDGEDVADIALSHAAHVLRDRGDGSLATVVDRALVDVSSRGASAALVLMADLPEVRPSDVTEILGALEQHDMALVRDHVGNHTNALALAPATAMRTSFGRVDSFEAHLRAARAARLRVAVVDNPRLAFDVDVPADHERITRGRSAVGSGSARRA